MEAGFGEHQTCISFVRVHKNRELNVEIEDIEREKVGVFMEFISRAPKKGKE
jgi:hypothetical protein